MFVLVGCTSGELDANGPDGGRVDPDMTAPDLIADASSNPSDTAPDSKPDAAVPRDIAVSEDLADAAPDADRPVDMAPDAGPRPDNVPAPCAASGPGSGPSRSWANAFGGQSFSNAGEPFQAVQYCFSMDQTTAVSFQIDANDNGGFFETHNGSGTAFGPVRWRAELSACRGRFTASDTSPCAIDQNQLRLEWARADLADQNPDRCILEANTTYYLNVRVTTPQPNTYCTNASGIELGPATIFCGGADPVGVCPMIPDGGVF